MTLLTFTTCDRHRHVIVAPSLSRRRSPPSPTSRGITAVQLRVPPPWSAAGSLKPG